MDTICEKCKCVMTHQWRRKDKRDRNVILYQAREQIYCGTCKSRNSLKIFPKMAERGTQLNIRQIIIGMYLILKETVKQVSFDINCSLSGVNTTKEYLWALLHCLYELENADVKYGGPGCIVEVDEAKIGNKPTYGHGKITEVFKVWVLGIKVLTIAN